MSDSQMRIASLSLKDFRNFERLTLDIPAEGMAVVGENGQGKTNLLESIYYLSLMRSVRGARDADVTRFDASGFFVEAQLCAPTVREVSVGFERSSKKKRVRIDGAMVERLSDALGALPAVMFSPADVAMVSGAPGERRRFLDIMLALSSKGYLSALQQYRAALERRNAALRESARSGRPGAIEVWEPALAEHGATLVRARRAWVARMAADFADYCARIGERGSVELSYETGVNVNAESVELALAETLASRRATDLRFGVTQFGPHRDDLPMLLDGRELRTFGSAGQQRTAAIALRTLEARTLRDARDVAPVFLLDDPFAELDERRAARVLGLLREVGLGQTILVVPRESDIPAELTGLRRCRVAKGQITWMGDS
jgi:DNA replication and repair protein RecF